MVLKDKVQAEAHDNYIQLKLYRDYAKAADNYNKKQTIENWELKEKAFETYNALVHAILSQHLTIA
ncbi:MAG TPA: hypothetical protein PLD88_04680 [Candidatus Berkiella sp.]|nr:hypothetical protein [Candidatus Berkiella sp.]